MLANYLKRVYVEERLIEAQANGLLAPFDSSSLNDSPKVAPVWYKVAGAVNASRVDPEEFIRFAFFCVEKPGTILPNHLSHPEWVRKVQSGEAERNVEWWLRGVHRQDEQRFAEAMLFVEAEYVDAFDEEADERRLAYAVLTDPETNLSALSTYLYAVRWRFGSLAANTRLPAATMYYRARRLCDAVWGSAVTSKLKGGAKEWFDTVVRNSCR